MNLYTLYEKYMIMHFDERVPVFGPSNLTAFFEQDLRATDAPFNGHLHSLFASRRN